jgi:hypothetical protein
MSQVRGQELRSHITPDPGGTGVVLSLSSQAEWWSTGLLSQSSLLSSDLGLQGALTLSLPALGSVMLEAQIPHCRVHTTILFIGSFV